MNDERTRTVGWSVAAGAFFGAVAFAVVLVADLATPAFAPGLDFVLSATAGATLAGSACWWLAAERPGVHERRRSAGVGAAVGLVSPALAFALNPSVYGSNANVLLDVVAGVVAAGVLGGSALLATYGFPVLLGAAAGWSLAGWRVALGD